MGIDIHQEHFDATDYAHFKKKLQCNLTALKSLLEQPSFGLGETSIGAELELYITNRDGQVRLINQQLTQDINSPQLQAELNRFNIEYNLTPYTLPGHPFTALEQEMIQANQRLNQAAAAYDAHVVPIGILPTLTLNDLSKNSLTDLPRYRALSKNIKQLKGQPFNINISGKESLTLQFDEVTLEGANTSCQFHWRVSPKQFAPCFNAVQLLTPVILGLAANSPIFLGHTLWDETRITLFKQAIDTRGPHSHHPIAPPSRISFGHHWIQTPWELFAQGVTYHPPLLPITDHEDPLAQIKQGHTPKLFELCLHQGTIWSWNRAIYDPTDTGHLRIEIRSLPAGPSHCDMTANAAFLIGAAHTLHTQMDTLLPAIPFTTAAHNFYEAAKHGIDAKLMWPMGKKHILKETPLLELAHSLLESAQDGLRALGVEEKEAIRLIHIIKDRIQSKTSGARWQLTRLQQYNQNTDRQDALKKMLQDYTTQQQTNRPVHEWPQTII